MLATRRNTSEPRGCSPAPSYSAQCPATGPAVAVAGRQWPDGTVDAAVSVYEGDGAQLDAAQARQLAAALLNGLRHARPPLMSAATMGTMN